MSTSGHKSCTQKIIGALMCVILALGGWNLNTTYQLSKDMIEIKVKIEGIEKVIGKKKKKKKD